MFSPFGEVQLQIEKLIAEGDDYVVCVTSLKGRGAASGAPLYLRSVNAYWFRDGKLVRAVGFLHTREALKAVGLEE